MKLDLSFTFPVCMLCIVCFILPGCHPTNREPLTASEILSAPPPIKAEKVVSRDQLFYRVYLPETRFADDGNTVIFYQYTLGKIKIESGKIIACDPAFSFDGVPFASKFPIGDFPVELAIAQFGVDERIGFSRIVFSRDSVVRWEEAMLPGQQPISPDSGMYYGYGVDSGTGMFADEVANRNFNPSGGNPANSNFFKALEENYLDTWNAVIYPVGTHNIAAFSSGYGDGSYVSYIGYAADGKIALLLTDFGLVPWS